MFDKVSEAAEKLATKVSRRAFMGRLGRAALAVSGALVGVLAIPTPLQAGHSKYCCVYGDPCRGGGAVLCASQSCPSSYQGFSFSYRITVQSCRDCALGCLG
jgi:hypothetical protein